MITKANMIRKFCEKAQEGKAAFFIGAGISVPYGLPDFKGLVKACMEGVIDDYSGKIDNCPEMMQFIANSYEDSKKDIDNKIRESFRIAYDSKKSTYLSDIIRSNVSTIWTTNFDTFIEQALNETKREFNVYRSEQEFEGIYTDQHKIEVLKVHGDIDEGELVVTKNDFEDFSVNHPIALKRLENDFLTKSMLFLGYSYNDPNIQSVVNSIRQLIENKEHRQEHYLTIKRIEGRGKKVRNQRTLQELWIKDLERYNIKTYVYKDFGELAAIISEISRKSKGNNVYVTGSHFDTENSLAIELGKKLSSFDNISVYYGASDGVGRAFCNSFVQEIIAKSKPINDRVKIFPNPYAFCEDWDNKDFLLDELSRLRRKLLRTTQIVVAFPGGKGTKTEIEVALEEGAIVVPASLDNEDFKKTIFSYPQIMNELEKMNPKYKQKLLCGTVSVEDITSCIQGIINDDK